MKNGERMLSRYVSPAALAAMPADTPLLLGFSGGGDSTCLLHLLAEECRKSGAALTLCHVHHGIRGDEADRDASFCASMAEKYGLPLLVRYVDVPTERRQGESTESAARRLRYGVFAEIMRERHIPLLVTAHHANDNLETVLFRLARGTGLRGLCGIAPVRPFPEAVWDETVPPCIVRPLLQVGRSEIEAALSALDLPFVTDSTNADGFSARNRLRAGAVPVLESIADHPEAQVARTCENLREDAAFLDGLAENALAKLTAAGDDCLSIASLQSLHIALRKRVLGLWLPDFSRLSGRHFDALLSLLAAGHGTLPPLPAKESAGTPAIVLRAENGWLKKIPLSCPAPAGTDYDLPLPQKGEAVYAGAFTVFAETAEICPDGQIIYKPFTRDILSFDTIDAYLQNTPDAALHLRPRREGDRLLLRGVDRILRKVQNECGVPVALRNSLPLLCDGEKILWAPFCGVSDLLRPYAAPLQSTAYLILILSDGQTENSVSKNSR